VIRLVLFRLTMRVIQWRSHRGPRGGEELEPPLLKSWNPVGIAQNRGDKYMGGTLVRTFLRSNYLLNFSMDLTFSLKT